MLPGRNEEKRDGEERGNGNAPQEGNGRVFGRENTQHFSLTEKRCEKCGGIGPSSAQCTSSNTRDRCHTCQGEGDFSRSALRGKMDHQDHASSTSEFYFNFNFYFNFTLFNFTVFQFEVYHNISLANRDTSRTSSKSNKKVAKIVITEKELRLAGELEELKKQITALKTLERQKEEIINRQNKKNTELRTKLWSRSDALHQKKKDLKIVKSENAVLKCELKNVKQELHDGSGLDGPFMLQFNNSRAAMVQDASKALSTQNPSARTVEIAAGGEPPWKKSRRAALQPTTDNHGGASTEEVQMWYLGANP
ncbi:hypothetical protein ACROYT_G015044 [Oculina patagonica]